MEIQMIWDNQNYFENEKQSMSNHIMSLQVYYNNHECDIGVRIEISGTTEGPQIYGQLTFYNNTTEI